MNLASDYKPEFDSLRNLLLEIAPERSVERLVQKVVHHLGERPHAVLAQVWLVDKGDHCAACLMREKCQDQSRCLHLVASAQSPLWMNNDQELQAQDQIERIPMGAGVIGRVAAAGEPFISDHPIQDLPEQELAGPPGNSGF